MTSVVKIFILRLWPWPMTEGRSLEGPNIWLRPKLKIQPSVQHCKLAYFLKASFLKKNISEVEPVFVLKLEHMVTLFWQLKISQRNDSLWLLALTILKKRNFESINECMYRTDIYTISKIIWPHCQQMCYICKVYLYKAELPQVDFFLQ